MTSHRLELESILSSDRVSDDPFVLEDFGQDRTRVFAPRPSLVVFPRTTEEVREVVRYCYDHRLPFVPSGGRTGYAGAAVAANGELVLSLSKMDRIVQISLIDGCVEVEAGAILQNVQEEVRRHGMLFPIDFASRGSCQIGGCIATNAGGLRVVKYGMTRESVMGIEVVTPTGIVLDLHDRLHKNNSGYDLKQLFIGAEGTLGVITKATLRVVSPPLSPRLALCAVNRPAHLVELLSALRRSGLDVLACEFFDAACLESVLQYRPELSDPFRERSACYVLVEADASEDAFTSFWEQMADEPTVADIVLAQSSADVKRLWQYRESISESLFAKGNVHKNDVAVPISVLPDFLAELERNGEDTLESYLFGHIGDGNIHLNVRALRDDFDPRAWDEQMCRLVARYRGTVSAEHGIGLLKKDLLALQRPSEQLDLMRKLKAVLDPAGICNPGKILDAEAT